MANWLSMQSTAEKYGIPEEQIREWIRLDYVTYSSFFKRELILLSFHIQIKIFNIYAQIKKLN